MGQTALKGLVKYFRNKQYLSNSFLNRGFGDKAVDHDLFVLTNSVSSAEGLYEKQKEKDEEEKNYNQIHRKSKYCLGRFTWKVMM